MGFIGMHFARKAFNKAFGKTTDKPIERKKDVRDDINDLKKQLLERLISDTSISEQNHIIELVSNLDEDGVRRIYFHAYNMNYGEYHPQQQDCYGCVDEAGLAEIYKSREPGEEVEAYSRYNQEEIKRIEDMKKIIEEGLQVLDEEYFEWKKLDYGVFSFIQKAMATIQGKSLILNKELREMLEKVPEKITEKIAKTNSLREELKVEPSENNTQPVVNNNTQEVDKQQEGR